MVDKLIGLVALAAFILFVAVLAMRVDETNLNVVIGIGVAMAVFDFFRQLFLKPRNGDKK